MDLTATKDFSRKEVITISTRDTRAITATRDTTVTTRDMDTRDTTTRDTRVATIIIMDMGITRCYIWMVYTLGPSFSVLSTFELLILKKDTFY